MYLGVFGCFLRLALLFGTTNPLNMALFSIVVANLVLVKAIVLYVCSHLSGSNGGWSPVSLVSVCLCSVNLSTRGTGLESEASRMAVSIATIIFTALEYFILASDSNRFWICIFRSPQTSLSRSPSFRYLPKLVCRNLP